MFISQLIPTLESKVVSVSERGLTSMQWSVYNEATKRTQYSTVPTSSITAEAVTVDGTITTVHCEYDYMGRRATKQVTTNGSITLHQRYIYRGYLQIACIDLTRAAHPGLWLITWDPTQNIATRPLAIQKDGTWYTYGWDLTKNICEVYGPSGYIRTAYTYTPYGQVTTDGDVTQPIQWSSEFNDTELGLIYYNYRHYNPVDGRWTGRDTINTNESYKNAYIFDLKKYLQDINRLLFFLYVIIVEIQGNIEMKRGWITIGRKMLSCYMKRSTRLIGAHLSVTKR